MVVLLQSRAATGGVREDGIEVFGEEGNDIFSRYLAGGLSGSSVRGECAAAKLIVRDDDFDAVSVEHAQRGLVEFREGDVGDASGEESDTRTLLSDSRESLAEAAEEKAIVNWWQKAFLFSEAEKREDAGFAGQRLQTGALIEAKQAGNGGDALWVREQMMEDEAARDAREKRTLIVSLDAGTSEFHELSVLDAGGACGFAGAAVEAFIDVVDEAGGDGLFAVFHVNHLLDAPAGRVGFQIPQPISGTGVEAEAAMRAAGIVFVNGVEAGDGSAGHDGWIERSRTLLCRVRLWKL